MIWHSSNNHQPNDDDDENLTRSSTIHSIANHHLIPPTPIQKNIFSRAYSSLFGNGPPSTAANTATTTPKADFKYDDDDYTAPLNQSMRNFQNLSSSLYQDPLTPSVASETNKKVNWGDYETRDRTSDEFYDSDDEVNETLNSIRNIKTNDNNNIPGTYPERFPSPYIPRNFKIDQDVLDNRQVLQKYLNQINETNKFLQELLSIQQYENSNQKTKTLEFINLKKEYAKELETSKQVYEGFRKLLFKYKSVKDQLKAIENGDLKTSSDNVHDLQLELESSKRSLYAKSKRIEELQRDLKKSVDQRDDLKTTILEYKNQILRLKNSNEMLKDEATKATNLQKNDDESVSMLAQKNEMLELQITRTNEMFKSQSNALKEQIFDLQSDLKREKQLHEYEIYSKDKRIEELEKLLSFKSPSKTTTTNNNKKFESINNKSSRSRPASYHEPSARILSPIRLNLLGDRAKLPNKSRYRSEVLRNIDDDENSNPRISKNFKPRYDNNDYSISDISAILNNNHSEDLTGFDSDLVTKRLMNKEKGDAHDLSAIFASSF